MGNGADILDEKGCEFGRICRKDIDQIRENMNKLDNIQEDIQTIKIQNASKSWEHTIAILAVNAVLMGIGFWALINTVKSAMGG